MADDIGMWEGSTYDIDSSSDTILAVMAKLWKRKRQEVLDSIDARNSEIRQFASALEKLSPGGKANYAFMLQYDQFGEFTGRYVQRIGYEYWRLRHEARAGLIDEEGTMERLYFYRRPGNCT